MFRGHLGGHHFLTPEDDPDPATVAAVFREAIAPGSYLVVSHASADPDTPAAGHALDDAAGVYEEASSRGATGRSPAEIEGVFGGFDLAEPGLVPVSRWRPDPGTDTSVPRVRILGGVGRKPAAQAGTDA